MNSGANMPICGSTNSSQSLSLFYLWQTLICSTTYFVRRPFHTKPYFLENLNSALLIANSFPCKWFIIIIVLVTKCCSCCCCWSTIQYDRWSKLVATIQNDGQRCGDKMPAYSTLCLRWLFSTIVVIFTRIFSTYIDMNNKIQISQCYVYELVEVK